MASDGKIPVTVVTGWLGAGKTTLVNQILTGSHGKKIAVIENEFGEVGIDDALVMESKEEIFEMNNGCICCTVRGDLIRILTKLLKRKNKFDAIMIETTGLADPAPVAQTFFVDEDLKASLRLDAILTVVDAKHTLQHLEEEKPDGVVNEAVQQVAFADRVLLNKVDLVSKEQKEETIDAIKAINRTVEIIECEHAKVDLDRILGLRTFDLEKILAMDPAFLKVEEEGHHETEHHHHHHHHDHEHHEDCAACKEEEEEVADCSACKAGDADPHHHHHAHHRHDSRVSSVGIELEGALDMRKMNEWLSTLLQEKGGDIYRSKGILSVAGSDDKFVFHGVHMMLQFGSSAEGLGKPWGPEEKRVSRVVFIGKDLDRAALNAGLRACLVSNGGAEDGGAA